MTTPGTNDPGSPRDAGNWATKVDRLAAPDEKSKVGYNITGKKVTGPQQGFGRLWQRTYSTNLGSTVGARALISDWKVNFGDYWPPGSVFHNSLTGIEPGAVTPIEVGIASHGPKLATGILVIYADEESFTFMTPEGHMFAGMITFSAEEDAGETRVEIKILIRPNDPIWELAWPVCRRKEDEFWMGTLTNLAAHYGLADAKVAEETVCVDRKRLWSNWRNVWHNSGIRSGIHIVTTPIRMLRPQRSSG
jgi:hypothetical protein